jgi:two-component system NtrC family sensor kinase
MEEPRPKILLVDDEPDFLNSLAQRLRLRGLSVLTAESGADALWTLEGESVEVVVLDVKMPGMDGVTALGEIKKRHPGVEVIMLTGHADLEASLEGMKLGFFDYLTKPVDIERLLAKINAARRRAGSGREAPPEGGFKVRLKERMVAADRLASLGILAGSIAHEINNPLALISESLGYMATILAKHPEIDPDLRKKLELAVDKAGSGVRRARRISQGLLSFARKTDQAVREIDLEQLAAEVVELTGKAASHAGAEVSVVSETAQAKVLTDPYLLRQVLLNLVTNAIQAVGKGGRVNLRIMDGPRAPVLAVEDNGPGIPPENLERIFEPFFTTKAPEEGTGLGLSVSRGIMEELGGSLEVESSPGRGATFRVALPPQPPAPPVDPH